MTTTFRSTFTGISTSCRRSVLILTCFPRLFPTSEIKELEEQRDAVKLEDESSVRMNSLCHISLLMVLACLCLPFLLMSDPSLLHLGMNSSFDMCPACICLDQRLPLPLTHLCMCLSSDCQLLSTQAAAHRPLQGQSRVPCFSTILDHVPGYCFVL